MAVRSALRRSPGAVVRNPALLVPILGVVLVQLPTVALQSVTPLLASAGSLVTSLVLVAAVPFLQAGLLAMADEALDGSTSLATFVDAGRRYYAPVLVAYLAILGVNAVVGLVVVVLAGVGGAIALGTGLAGASLPVVAAIGVLVAVVAVGYLAAIFLVQFYGQAIVLDGCGGVDGLVRSVAVVRATPTASIGYGIVAGLLGGAVGVVAGIGSAVASLGAAPAGITGPGSSAAGSLPGVSVPVVVAIGGAAVAAVTLVGGVLTVFSVAFYREITASVTHD